MHVKTYGVSTSLEEKQYDKVMKICREQAITKSTWLRVIIEKALVEMETNPRFVSQCCKGEKCWCGVPAEHKVEESIFPDDPMPNRHPLTTYICHRHFRQIMGQQQNETC